MQELTKRELQTAYETLNILYRSLSKDYENLKQENKILKRKVDNNV